MRGRVGFTLVAQQVGALYCQAAGRQLVGYGIRLLRRALNLALGGLGIVVVVDDCYAMLHAEDVLVASGPPVTQSIPRAITVPLAQRYRSLCRFTHPTTKNQARVHSLHPHLFDPLSRLAFVFPLPLNPWLRTRTVHLAFSGSP